MTMPVIETRRSSVILARNAMVNAWLDGVDAVESPTLPLPPPVDITTPMDNHDGNSPIIAPKRVRKLVSESRRVEIVPVVAIEAPIEPDNDVKALKPSKVTKVVTVKAPTKVVQSPKATVLPVAKPVVAAKPNLRTSPFPHSKGKPRVIPSLPKTSPVVEPEAVKAPSSFPAPRVPVSSFRGAFKRFSGVPEQDLIKAYQAGDTNAGGIICEIHVGFIQRMAFQYRWTKMEDEDLESYAKIGMIEAAKRYSTDHNTKLTTYASWWIRASIIRAYCNECGPIKLPQRVRSIVRKMRKEGLTMEEAENMGLITTSVGIEDIKSHLAVSFVSLQDPSHRHADFTHNIEDTVADDVDLIDEVVAGTIRTAADNAALKKAMLALDNRSAHIVKEMFLRPEERTLESVGIELGVTRERVRQLLILALNMLRQGMDEPGENADELAFPKVESVITRALGKPTQLTIMDLLTQRGAKIPKRHGKRRTVEPGTDKVYRKRVAVPA